MNYPYINLNQSSIIILPFRSVMLPYAPIYLRSSWINTTSTSRLSIIRPWLAVANDSAWLQRLTTPRPWWTTSCPPSSGSGKTMVWSWVGRDPSVRMSARSATSPWGSRYSRRTRKSVADPTVPTPRSRTSSLLIAAALWRWLDHM